MHVYEEMHYTKRKKGNKIIQLMREILLLLNFYTALRILLCFALYSNMQIGTNLKSFVEIGQENEYYSRLKLMS